MAFVIDGKIAFGFTGVDLINRAGPGWTRSAIARISAHWCSIGASRRTRSRPGSAGPLRETVGARSPRTGQARRGDPSPALRSFLVGRPRQFLCFPPKMGRGAGGLSRGAGTPPAQDVVGGRRKAAVLAYLAMGEQRLGQVNQARSHLDAARSTLRAFTAKSQNLESAWNDVLIAELALHEAKALIDPASTSRHDKARER